MNQKDHEEYQNALNAKMQKPVSKEHCPSCGEPLDHYHAVDMPPNTLHLPPKLTPIDKKLDRIIELLEVIVDHTGAAL